MADGGPEGADAIEWHTLPLYPIATGQLLKAEWAPLEYERFLNSKHIAWATRNPAAAWVWQTLMMEAFRQDPPGTLPLDDEDQCHFAGLGVDFARWRDLRAQGALRGWEPVLCLPDGEDVEPEDGEVRLAHPDVAKASESVLLWLRKSREKSEAATERALKSRLKTRMRECGAHAGLLERDDYVGAVWDWLRRHRRRWELPNVQQAMTEVSASLDADRDANVAALREAREIIHRRSR